VDKAQVWPAIRTERESLATDLAGCTDAQWATPSLCTEWTVQDVLAHMTAAAKTDQLQFVGRMVVNGFRFEKLQAKGIAAEEGASGAETLTNFRATVDSTKHPPGPTGTWLGEVLVHSEDIRRPLGIEHDYPSDLAVSVADFYQGSNLIIGAKKRIAGLRLQATDADWSHGEGAAVTGPIVSLVLAMAGRRQALDDLTGDGVATLRSRS
jgi:uncharacterized protein (TIGR03083 family)